VIDIEDLDAQAPALMARIRAASPEQPKAQRERWLDFRFYPALDDATLDYLRRLDAALWAEVEPEAGAPIDALPFRINQILLRVFTALLFGQHRDAGCALAAYAGIMKPCSTTTPPPAGSKASIRRTTSPTPWRAHRPPRHRRGHQLGLPVLRPAP
jgi:hypothetical protein